MQVGAARSTGREIGAKGGSESVLARVPQQQARRRASQCDAHGLVEYQRGARLILAAHGLGDQRHCAHAQHLREGQNEKAEIASRCHSSDGGVAKAPHKIEIDQEIQGLKQHADRDRRRHGQQMAAQRPRGEIFHGRMLTRQQINGAPPGIGVGECHEHHPRQRTAEMRVMVDAPPQ